VVLDELHVFQRRASPEREGHSVSGLDVRIGGERKHAPTSAGAHDHSVGEDRLDATGRQLDGDNAAYPAVVDQQGRREPLVVTHDVWICQGALKQRVQEVKSGLVRGKPRA
jgi:hypothetical protein